MRCSWVPLHFRHGRLLVGIIISHIIYFTHLLSHAVRFYNCKIYSFVDVLGSTVGFAVFTVVLLSWALTFAIGGEHLFGSAWDKLVMYNVTERLGLTGWS